MKTAAKVDWHGALREGTGRGVRIGLLDTGANSEHPDLIDKIAAHYEARVDVEHGRVVPCERGLDYNNHGTACAGILSELAPGAEIHSIQIVGDRPRDSPLKLCAALCFAVEQRIEVITVNAGMTSASPELLQLTTAAWERGIIVIAAKDNRPEVIGYPAAFPQVLAVDMEHFDDPFQIRYHSDSLIEVEAAGIYIDAPCNHQGRHAFTGSSFAAPHLAAIAAKLKEVVPGMHGGSFREALAQLTTCPLRSENT